MLSRRPVRHSFMLACAVAFLVPAAASAVTPNGRLQIVHMNVGQGDGTVLISPLGECVLIDDGVNTNTSAPVQQLAALGVTHVKLHFASHFHSDHIGAITQIVQSPSNVTIDAGWDRSGTYPSSAFTSYNTTLGVKRHTLVKNQVWTLDSLSAHPVTIKCVDLGGAGVATTDENALSVVLKVSYGAFDEVFGGDLVGDATQGGDVESVIGPEVGEVEVYKVHHHGSRYSSNNNWLNAIAPKIGVIQCGDGNPYGHPTPEALSRLHTHGVHTYWNQTGALVATPDPSWDKVANGQVIIQATWEAGGVDTVRGPGFTDTFTNYVPDVINPVVSVLTPNGGNVLTAGGQFQILYSASDERGVTGIDLDYSLDGGGNWINFGTNIGNTGGRMWTVPNAPSTNALVRVSAHDLAGNIGSDASDASFTIADVTAPLAHVVTPNGGETWEESTNQVIRWTATDNVGVDSVNIDLSIHGVDGPWSPIQHGIAGVDSFVWSLPIGGTDSAAVRVVVFDHASNQTADASDAIYRIHTSVPTGVTPGVAGGLDLAIPRPNPSAGRMRLAFTLPQSGDARLDVMDVGGRRVWSWSGAALGAGAHDVTWDGVASSGNRAGEGLYFVRLTTAFGNRTVRLVRLH